MYCVAIADEIVYATTDWNRYVRTVSKKYARINNARLMMTDGTSIKLA